MNRSFIVGLVLLSLFSSPSLAYDNMVSLGDSLSDSYFRRWSDGPLWTDYLASDEFLSCSLDMRAVTGDTSEEVLEQAHDYLNDVQSGLVDPFNTLFTLWAGGNDYINELNPITHPIMINIAETIDIIVEAGARDIVICNLPNFGRVPAAEEYFGPASVVVGEFGNAISLNYDFQLDLVIQAKRCLYPDVTFYYLDIYGLVEDVCLDPNKYGFDNVTDRKEYNLETDDIYLFYDEVHPTTYAHHLIAAKAYELLNQ